MKFFKLTHSLVDLGANVAKKNAPVRHLIYLRSKTFHYKNVH